MLEVSYMPIRSPKQYFADNRIVVDNITCGYLNESQYILKNLSVEIPAQCITAIVGSNGAGKSTFMRSLFGLQKIQHGLIKVFGINSQDEFRKLIKICSYVSQQPIADFEMTGLEILNYFGSMYRIPKQSRDKKIIELVKLFHLQKNISNKIASYSGGNLQKIHLAIGLINHPWVLMLDEPTNNLDAISKHEVWSYLQDRSRRDKKTSVVISHDLDCIEKYADHLVVMNDGEVLYQGGIHEFINKASIQTKRSLNNNVQDQQHIGRSSTSHCQSINQQNQSNNPSMNLQESSSSDLISSTSLFDALCKFTNFNYYVTAKTSIHERRGRHLSQRGRRKRG